MTNNTIQAVKLTLHNVMGIEDLTIGFSDRVTVIKGRNGTGKTSVIQALMAMPGGGHDATLKRAGSESGEIVFVMSQNGQPLTYTRRITDSRTTPTLRGPDNERIDEPQAFIRELFDGVSFNPLEFIKAKPRDRARILLEQLNVRVTAEQLIEAGIAKVDESYLRMHGMDAIAALDAEYRKIREGIGGQKRKASDTVVQLTATLPPDRPDISTALSAKRAELQAKKDNLAQKREEVGGILRNVQAEIQEKYNGNVANIDLQIQDLQRKIAKLESDKAVLAAERDREFAEAKDQARAQFGVYENRERDAMATLQQEISALEAEHEAQIRANEVRFIIDRERTVAEQLQLQWDELKGIIDALERLKYKLLESISEAGFADVSVRDGDIYMGDVPFDRLNTTTQWFITLRIAKLRRGRLGFVVIDGIEFMDGENFRGFVEAVNMIEPPMQFVVTRVTDDPQLTVETYGEQPRLFAAPPPPTPYEGEDPPKKRGRR